MIATVLKHFFTGKDNESFELGRALWAVGVLAVIAFQGYAIYRGQAFNPTEFGLAVASVLAAGGVGVAVKDRANRDTVAAG